MPQDKADRYHAQPDEAFNSTPEPLAEGFAFATSQPPPDPDFRESGGRFRKGHDPRRHRFTREECSRGFWTGIAVYAERGGDPRYFLRNMTRRRAAA